MSLDGKRWRQRFASEAAGASSTSLALRSAPTPWSSRVNGVNCARDSPPAVKIDICEYIRPQFNCRLGERSHSRLLEVLNVTKDARRKGAALHSESQWQPIALLHMTFPSPPGISRLRINTGSRLRLHDDGRTRSRVERLFVDPVGGAAPQKANRLSLARSPRPLLRPSLRPPPTDQRQVCHLRIFFHKCEEVLELIRSICSSTPSICWSLFLVHLSKYYLVRS